MKPFHVTSAGRAVNGAPPSTAEPATKGLEDAAPPDRAQEVDEWFGRLSGAIFSPRAAMILVGLVVLSVGSTLYSRGESLEETARKVALAAYNGDKETLRSLSVDGAEDEVDQWLGGMQVQLEQLKKSLGETAPSVQVEVKGQEAGRGVADVVARVSSEQELARHGLGLPDPLLTMTSGNKTVELPLRFQKAFWVGWRFDARRAYGPVAQAP
jgi:hypothetical protein